VDHQDLRPAIWRKSSYSANGSTCVAVARNLPGIVAVRDSKDPGGQTLTFSRQQWAAFVSAIKQTNSV
jgi:hypothetical protein